MKMKFMNCYVQNVMQCCNFLLCRLHGLMVTSYEEDSRPTLFFSLRLCFKSVKVSVTRRERKMPFLGKRVENIGREICHSERGRRFERRCALPFTRRSVFSLRFWPALSLCRETMSIRGHFTKCLLAYYSRNRI